MLSKYVSVIVLVLLALLFVTMVAAPTWASDDRHTQTVDTVVSVDAPSNVSTTIGGNKAYAFSGGDMDIRDCLATYSVLFGLWQDTRINPMCVAEKLDAVGKYQEAAEMRCSTSRFKRVYGRGEACIAAVKLTAPPPAPTPAALPIDDAGDDEDAIDLEEYERLQAQQEQLLGVVDALEREVVALKDQPTQVQYLPDPQLQRRLEEDARRRERAAKILEQAEKKGEQ